MACSGLHCAGCSGGLAVPPIAFVYAYGLGWLAEHAAAVAVTSAVCGALAVAAVVALMRWQDRRQARHAAQASIWTARAIPSAELSADGIAREVPLSGTRVPDPLASAGRRELNPPAIHLHFHGLPDAEQAAVIRHALGRNER